MSLQNLTVIRECIFNPRLLFKIQLLSKIQSVHTVISFLKEYLHINNYWQAYTKIKKSGQAYTKMPAFILFNRYCCVPATVLFTMDTVINKKEVGLALMNHGLVATALGDRTAVGFFF